MQDESPLPACGLSGLWFEDEDGLEDAPAE